MARTRVCERRAPHPIGECPDYGAAYNSDPAIGKGVESMSEAALIELRSDPRLRGRGRRRGQ